MKCEICSVEIEKGCIVCGKIFKPKRPRRAKYCSAKCRQVAWRLVRRKKA